MMIIEQGEAMGMSMGKQHILQAMKQLPDDATVEDAIERLCFLAKVEEGLRQSETGVVVSHDEAKRRSMA